MPETTREPSGKYPHPAAVHHLDLNAEADRLLSQLSGAQRQSENIARESGVSLVLIAQPEGDVMPEHSAPGTVTVQVLRGEIELRVEGSTTRLAAGHAAMLQPSVAHSHRAETESVVLLTVTGGAP